MLDRKKTYLVYCKGGGRSKKAMGVLKDLNFNNLYHLFKGYEAWKQDGYKTVNDPVWVPPLLDEQFSQFDVKRIPALSHFKYQLYILGDIEKTIGRIAADKS
jgi:hypothetical protein